MIQEWAKGRGMLLNGHIQAGLTMNSTKYQESHTLQAADKVEFLLEVIVSRIHLRNQGKGDPFHLDTRQSHKSTFRNLSIRNRFKLHKITRIRRK